MASQTMPAMTIKPIPEPTNTHGHFDREVQTELGLTNSNEQIDDVELTSFAGDGNDETKAIHFRQCAILGLVDTIFLSESIERRHAVDE